MKPDRLWNRKRSAEPNIPKMRPLTPRHSRPYLILPNRILKFRVLNSTSSQTSGGTDPSGVATFPARRDIESKAILSVKAAAIIGVVFHHIANRRFHPDAQDTATFLAELFGWVVFAFIGLSGWLHAMSQERRPRGVLTSIGMKFRRLMIPYASLVLLYAAIWQGIQRFGIAGIGDRLPKSFLSKIYRSFTGGDFEPVAEQLYFFPLLFFVAVLGVVAINAHHLFGPALLAAASLVAGILLTPDSADSGFSAGVFLFAIFSYSAGILLFHFRENKHRWTAVILVSVIVILSTHLDNWTKVAPLFLMAGLPGLKRFSLPPLEWIGKASGTIFAYHTPFILQPMIVISARLPDGYHIPAMLASSALAILVCATAHHVLKTTPLRRLLL